MKYGLIDNAAPPAGHCAVLLCMHITHNVVSEPHNGSSFIHPAHICPQNGNAPQLPMPPQSQTSKLRSETYPRDDDFPNSHLVYSTKRQNFTCESWRG